MGKAKTKAASKGKTETRLERGDRTELPRVVPLSVWMAYVDRVWRRADNSDYRFMKSEESNHEETLHYWDPAKKCMQATEEKLPAGWDATDSTEDLDHWGINGQLVGPKKEIEKLSGILEGIRDLQSQADEIIYGRWNG